MKRDYKICDKVLDSLASRREVERSRGQDSVSEFLEKQNNWQLVVCTVVSLSFTFLNRVFQYLEKQCLIDCPLVVKENVKKKMDRNESTARRCFSLALL